VSEDLLQSPDIDTVPDHVDGIGMPKAVGVYVLASSDVSPELCLTHSSTSGFTLTDCVFLDMYIF
jgi:hypothetical protein